MNCMENLLKNPNKEKKIFKIISSKCLIINNTYMLNIEIRQI